jgi:hypothetical protein
MLTVAFLANLSTAEHKRRWDLLNKHADDGVNVVVADPTGSPGKLIEALKDADAAVPWLASIPPTQTLPEKTCQWHYWAV